MKSAWIVILLLLLFPAAALAQRTANVNVGYVGIDGPQLPAWMAKEAGIFQKNGVDVQVVNFTGGATAPAAPLPGGVPFPPNSPPPARGRGPRRPGHALPRV